LGQLAHKGRSIGIPVDNVEYRYCRVASIGPLLSNLKANPQSFRSSATISTLSLHKEIADEIEKIKKYNDGKYLNAIYRRTVGFVGDILSKMGFEAEQSCSVAQYCSRLKSQQYRQELEKLCIFDSALIDMNIMHAIAASPETSFIVVVAGGAHIEQMGAMLRRIGYESVFKSLQPSSPTIKKVLNSDSASASSDIHPQPIDISIIDRFIR
jgi:hypothetical protein